jgi:ketosteroid isomerase-like protein
MAPPRSPESLALAASKEAVVRQLVDALDRRDGAAIGALLSDDVVYQFPGRSVVAGTYRGRDEVLGLFRAFGALFDAPPSMASHDVVASEAHVVELATYSASRGGAAFEWNVARVYHVDGDRIGEVWLMIGDIYTFDAFLEAD